MAFRSSERPTVKQTASQRVNPMELPRWGLRMGSRRHSRTGCRTANPKALLHSERRSGIRMERPTECPTGILMVSPRSGCSRQSLLKDWQTVTLKVLLPKVMPTEKQTATGLELQMESPRWAIPTETLH